MLSDDACLEWLRGLLEGLATFERIYVGRLAQPHPGDGLPSAWAYGLGGKESSPPEFSPDRIRTFGYEVQIAVSVDGLVDGPGPLQLLDALSNQVANAIAATPPADCLPALCELERVDYPQPGRDGTTSAKLVGQVVYLIDTPTGRDPGQ
jgi:hypothetical protein